MAFSQSLRAVLLSIFTGALLTAAQAAEALPKNLGGGLDKLVAWHLAHAPLPPGPQKRALLDAEQPTTKRAQVDPAAVNATVDVRLDGSRTVAQVRTTLEALGCTVLGANDLGRAGSVISITLPLGRALDASRAPGVLSLVLAKKPRRHVGAVTSQGVGVLKAENLQANGTTLTGSGLTVGVISDSYDRTAPGAAADIASGDLPGAGNPLGHTDPVLVLEDAPADSEDNTDEGRGMLQIVHDVAPGAKLAFSAVGVTQTMFAAAIRALRTDALADVIVDDISFPDEPFFSDGPVAQAVDEVVHSTMLAGKRVAYYSAAGNDGTNGFSDTFRPISNAEVRAKRPKNNLKLKTVQPELTAGGFHNFGSDEAPVITQKITIEGDNAEIDLQWDDAFVPAPGETQWITTDYNLLLFTASGTFIGQLSGVDDNVATGQPAEFAVLLSGARGQKRSYQIAITRKAGGTPQANRLRYVLSTDGLVESVPFQRIAPVLYGHCGAPGADAVAAYEYAHLNAPEDFSSAGPLTIVFDTEGNRLPEPEVRLQPSVAAPDNVDTSFFPPGAENDTDDSGFPNFSGTSAAAPHAAGVAALLLEAAGGPDSLSDTELRTALQGSASVHDVDPGFSKAEVTSGGATATIEARGDDGNQSSTDPRFFKLRLAGPDTVRITQVVIDLAPAGLVFDPSGRLGMPFRAGAFTGIAKRDFSATVSRPPRSMLTVTLKRLTFAPGATLEFGIDRDLAVEKSGGNSADLLTGATVTVTFVDNEVITESTATFQNKIRKGFSPLDGFGLINAQAAVTLLP